MKPKFLTIYALLTLKMLCLPFDPVYDSELSRMNTSFFSMFRIAKSQWQSFQFSGINIFENWARSFSMVNPRFWFFPPSCKLINEEGGGWKTQDVRSVWNNPYRLWGGSGFFEIHKTYHPAIKLCRNSPIRHSTNHLVYNGESIYCWQWFCRHCGGIRAYWCRYSKFLQAFHAEGWISLSTLVFPMISPQGSTWSTLGGAKVGCI